MNSSKEIYYKVADLTFKVVMPSSWDEFRLLPAYKDFMTGPEPESALLFAAYINDGQYIDCQEELKVIGTSDNDMGHMVLMRGADTYWAELSYENAGLVHRWKSDKAFEKTYAQLAENDTYLPLALTSVLRIAFALSILRKNGISIHASCVWQENRAYLFLGKSGTGKSTHARMWMEHLEGVNLLNDDNPALRIIDGQTFVYGTPWSGKTPCYKQLVFPVQAIVRLEQGPKNILKCLDGIEAFSAVLPSCSVVQNDSYLQDLLYDTLIEITENVKVAWLKCLPDAEAAILCHKVMQ